MKDQGISLFAFVCGCLSSIDSWLQSCKLLQEREVEAWTQTTTHAIDTGCHEAPAT